MLFYPLGIQIIHKFLHAKPESLGFIQFILPTQIQVGKVNVINLKILQEGTRNKRAYVCTGHVNGKKVVVKFGGSLKAVRNEAKVLEYLYKNVEHEHAFFPKLEASDKVNIGTLYDVDCIVISPYCSVFDFIGNSLDVAKTCFNDIHATFTTVHRFGILHHDLSTSNLLQFDGHGYVGDWALASLPSESNSKLSCTQRFASNGLLIALLKNEDYDYKAQDDLEGLFYCLLDIFFNGHLPWYHQEHINEWKSFIDLRISYVYYRWKELFNSMNNDLKEHLDLKEYLDNKRSILLPKEAPKINF